ncbi:hypothetical protein [Azotobacter armeniacus]
MLWLWSNLPEEAGATQIIRLYRQRWRIEGLLIALPADQWPTRDDDSASGLARRQLELAQRIVPKQVVATSKRGPKADKPREWIDGATARTHASTARVIKAAKSKRP